jgi:hypothetical protein
MEVFREVGEPPPIATYFDDHLSTSIMESIGLTKTETNSQGTMDK